MPSNSLSNAEAGPKVVFVIGMHRSGTSAFTASLSACGLNPGNSLLSAMEGVNDQGFWEDRRLVAINEAILDCSGVKWYALGSNAPVLKYGGEIVTQAINLLADTNESTSVRVFKDPRLCITLPFWVDLCVNQGMQACFCFISREPLEVAKSLLRRDGFPVVYGLWLHENYMRLVEKYQASYCPQYSTTYSEFLSSPSEVLKDLERQLSLGLNVDENSLNKVVDPNLRHHLSGDLVQERQVYEGMSVEDILTVLIESFVSRGKTLSSVGSELELAQSVVRARDGKIEEVNRELSRIGSMHSVALSTLRERDSQLVSANATLKKIGIEHSYALSTISERDMQLQTLQYELLSKENELSHLREELAFKSSWKNKILSALNFFKKNSKS